MWVSCLKLSYYILRIIGNTYFYKVAVAAFAADEVDHRFSPLRFVGAVRPPNIAQNVETGLIANSLKYAWRGPQLQRAAKRIAMQTMTMASRILSMRSNMAPGEAAHPVLRIELVKRPLLRFSAGGNSQQSRKCGFR